MNRERRQDRYNNSSDSIRYERGIYFAAAWNFQPGRRFSLQCHASHSGHHATHWRSIGRYATKPSLDGSIGSRSGIHAVGARNSFLVDPKTPQGLWPRRHARLSITRSLENDQREEKGDTVEISSPVGHSTPLRNEFRAPIESFRLRVRAKITSDFGGSAAGPDAKHERWSVSAAIPDRPSNEAGGPAPPRPCGLRGLSFRRP